jgi:hypothetical protein
MLHVHGKPPIDLNWAPCVHRPTRQRYVVLDQDCSVETVHGTMAARKGDVLMEGENRALYVLTWESFQAAYFFRDGECVPGVS